MGSCCSCFRSREYDELFFHFNTTRLALCLTDAEFWRLYKVFKEANLSDCA